MTPVMRKVCIATKIIFAFMEKRYERTVRAIIMGILFRLLQRYKIRITEEIRKPLQATLLILSKYTKWHEHEINTAKLFQ